MHRVCPPLIPCVAALGALPFRPVVDRGIFDRPPRGRDEFARAQRILTDNPTCFWQFFTCSRLACLPFSLIGGYICWRFAGALFGGASGLMALLLWSSSPAILAHASMLTTDAHAATLAVATVAAFWFWLKSPVWPRALLLGTVLGLAALTKFTLLAFYPLLPPLWLLYRLPDRHKTSKRDWLRQAGMFVVAGLLSVFVINLGYLFSGCLARFGDFQFRTVELAACKSQRDVPPPGANLFSGTWFGQVPLPLPADMVQGIDDQRLDFERGLPSYMHGKWSDHGWWYYYLYAAAIKEPLGTLCLAALAIAAAVLRRDYRALLQDELVVLAPLIAIIVFVSSQTGFSTHSRYTIPALPFLFIWISRAARVFHIPRFAGARGVMAGAVIIGMTWSVGSSLAIYPFSLSYFNELVGGPKGGPKHLLDSNIDWGQDLSRLTAWLERHPDVTLNGLACYGSFPAELAGIPRTRCPEPGPECGGHKADQSAAHLGPKPGWYALSVNYLYDRSRQYRHFLRFEPVAMAGYSIYIYHITRNEANRVRSELGLPELKGK
ncbi:MAG: ArnT family glycosyltransferase [Thermoguttaceae bacterium]